MILLLQDFVPSGDSLRWQAHAQYYQEEGLNVFLRQEVPYNITSNPCYARQVAALVVAQCIQAQASQNTEPQGLRILELGGGNGLFAFNFLRAFAQLAPEHLPHLNYVLSDFSASMLHSLSAHPAFAHWQRENILSFEVVNAQNPEKTSEPWDAIIANYLFSTFPTEVLCKPGAEWHVEHTRLQVPMQTAWLDFVVKYLCQQNLGAPLAEDHPHKHSLTALYTAQEQVAAHLSGVRDQWENPEWESETACFAWLESQLLQHWESPPAAMATPLLQQLLLHPLQEILLPFAWEDLLAAEQAPNLQRRFYPLNNTVLPPTHTPILEQLSTFQPFAYAPKVLQALEHWQSQLKPTGLLLVSDKAQVETPFQVNTAPQIARHGGTLSHALHWPLYRKALPDAFFTERPHHAIQSLCYSPQPSAALKGTFQQDWIAHPRHLISHALLEGGQALLQADRVEAAYRSLKEALDDRPEDSTLQYFCALCCLSQGDPLQALAILEVPHDDIFGLFNRDILKAEAYQSTGQYALAIPAYQASLQYGENALSYYQMALCQQALSHSEAALESLRKAEALHPEDTDIQELKAVLEKTTR